ncbi:hypothetical protein ABFS83_12G009100 [Erythranthe nasuta]
MERVHNMHEDKRTRVICSRDHNNQTSPEKLGNNNNINIVKTRLNNSNNNNNNNVVMKATFKKVQIVYYISRNGHLQHPHYIEVSHLAHQHLRLKDVLDRLTVLRGKGMPSLYSWSCKRSYKNGYVWNDLALNDVVYPSEGAEYVLKASELLLPSSTEKLHHLQIGNAQEFQFGGGGGAAAAQGESDVYPKRKSLPTKRQDQYHQYEENVAAEDEEYEAGKTVVHTRCSTGVSTEEIQEFKLKIPTKSTIINKPTEINLDANSFSSPPSTTSPTLSDHSNNEISIIDSVNVNSKRFVVEDGDPVGNEPMLSRNSMLFSLIACGGSGPSFRKTAPPLPPTPPRKSGGSLHRGVVCKAAAAARVAVEDEEDEEEVVMIKYMSENPRFGNMQSEEKEYFSGSIVESIATEERLGGSGLKKSSSYNQERSKKCGMQAEEEAEEEVKKEKGIIGKCMPRKKSSSSKNPKK